MMSFENFVGTIKMAMEYKGYSVKLHRISKNGKNLTGLTLVNPAKKANKKAPVFCLDSAYEDYKNGKVIIAEIINRIDDFYSNVNDFDIVKTSIIPKVIGKAGNEEVLKEAIWMPVGGLKDLVITFRVIISVAERELETYLLTKNMWPALRSLDIEDEDILLDVAKENYKDIFGINILRVRDIVLEAKKREEEEVADIDTDNIPDMIAVTNLRQICGATALLFPEYLDLVREEFNCENLLIIPSSIHVLTALDADMANDSYDALVSIVEEVNDNESVVKNEEKLSNNIYFYDGNSIVAYK